MERARNFSTVIQDIAVISHTLSLSSKPDHDATRLNPKTKDGESV
jgi:hypothetical protein